MALNRELAGIRKLIRGGHFDEALSHLSLLVEMHPEEGELRELLSQLRIKTGKDQVLGRKCPVCGAEDLFYEIIHATAFGDHQTFLRCDDCGVVFDEKPRKIDYTRAYYDTNPFLNLKSYVERNTSFLLPTYILLQIERTFRSLGLDPAGRRLAEIGCGPGVVVDIARYLGWKAAGVDSSIEACTFGRSTIGVPVVNFTVNHTLPLKNLDAIYSSHLIEHFASPRLFLRAVYNALGPDGVAVFMTPNVASKSYLDRRADWPHVGLGYHFLLHTPGSMERLLEEAGFRGVLIYSFNGEYEDEELICIATKQRPGFAFYDLPLHPFGRDEEAARRCLAYCERNVSRHDGDRNSLWLGSQFRILELLNGTGKHGKAVATANALEAHLASRGITLARIEAVLDEVHAKADRSIFYRELHAFLPDLYYLRGLARQQLGELEGSLGDLFLSYKLWARLETLPGQSWSEVAYVPPSLRCLYSVGVSLSRLEKHEEAREVLAAVLERREELAHASSFLANALYQYARTLEALGRLEESCTCLDAMGKLYHGSHLCRDMDRLAKKRLVPLRARIAHEAAVAQEAAD